MKRRVVLGLVLLGLLGGSAGAALAAPGASVDNHNVCIQFAQNGDYQHTKYLCIDTP
jgi:hypothetical protein